MRHLVTRWHGITSGWQPAHGSRPRTRQQAENFARLCRAVNGDLYCYRVEVLPLELPSFL